MGDDIQFPVFRYFIVVKFQYQYFKTISNRPKICYLVTSVYQHFGHPVISIILLLLTGNLALSRALGDFSYKKNTSKTAEQQMVTGEIECEIICRLMPLA